MKFSRRWPWLFLLIPMAIGFARLRFDVEVLNLLPTDSGIVEGLKLYQQNFSNGRELIVLIHSDDADKSETVARSLAGAIRRATNLVEDVTWQPGWLEYPAQSAELVAFLWLNQSPEIFGQLTNRLRSDNLPAILSATKEQLATSLSPNAIAMSSYDPFNLMRLPESASSAMPIGTGEELFASADGKYRLVYVEANSDLASYRDCRKWLEEIKTIIMYTQDSTGFPKDISIEYTGRPAFVTEIAGGMEHDMFASVGGTMVIIAFLFWVAHRRFLPLLWILALLIFILAGTMALGGLIFGTLNVVSMGFAAILLGLAVDYGLLLYQEAQAAPHLTAKQIRHELTPSILWSAVTTAGAFALLNFGGLPGLGQLGSLVAIGVALAGVVMLFAYLPVVERGQKVSDTPTDLASHIGTTVKKSSSLIWLVTVVFLAATAFVLIRTPPRFDNSPDALRPKNSPAYAAVEKIKHVLGRVQEPLWLLVRGRDEAEVSQRLQQVEAELNSAVSNQLISSFTLPTMLWPQPQNQFSNRPALKTLVGEKAGLRSAALAEGFTSNSFALTENLFDTWKNVLQRTNIFWPTNQASRWILDKVVAKVPQGFVSVGLIYVGTNYMAEADPAQAKSVAAALAEKLKDDDVILSGWSLLGLSMFDLVKTDFPKVLIPISILLVVSLWLAFRNVKELLLSFMTLVFSGGILLLVMALADWTWNLMNMMAVPLLLGTGVDFSIHMQLALRRSRGDMKQIRKSVSRALLLAGSTTVAGFGSLSFSSNTGLSSLGFVCATGIAASMLTSIYLLPLWWRNVMGNKISGVSESKIA